MTENDRILETSPTSSGMYLASLIDYDSKTPDTAVVMTTPFSAIAAEDCRESRSRLFVRSTFPRRASVSSPLIRLFTYPTVYADYARGVWLA